VLVVIVVIQALEHTLQRLLPASATARRCA
jgi:hypothetical protein